MNERDAFAGTLIGTAEGDALGLPMEGLSARRQQRLFSGDLRQRFAGKFGMISDDTEHTVMVAQSLLEHPGDPAKFQKALARRFRWWLIGLPAGVGFATLRAILKLWLGFRRSGVKSAGNGPAMRSAILGVYFADSPTLRLAFVNASTTITHTDPRAKVGALAIAELAAWIANSDPGDPICILEALDAGSEWQTIMTTLRDALSARASVREFAALIGAEGGVSGYAYQSVPVAIFATLRHQDDFCAALAESIACGGDTDTVGAMVGALVGARVGDTGIPRDWIDGLIDWPRSVSLFRRIATRLGEAATGSKPAGAVRYFWPAIPVRNLVFLAIVLSHGFRRLLPPY